MPQPEAQTCLPRIIAHRGARTEAPENTAAAIDRAIAHCIDGVEVDVQMSADGVLLLHHDRTLKKIAGTRRRVSDLTWEELKGLDAGSWFDPAFAGERLLEFDRLLETFAGRTRLFIEIKAFESDRRNGRALRLTDAVLQALASPGFARHRQRLRVLSFDPEILRYAGKKAPDLPLVLDVSRADARRLKQLPADLLERLSAFCVHHMGISRRRAGWVHGLGKQIYAYTCNEPETIRKMTAAGVDAILTDHPGWLAAEFTGRKSPGGVRAAGNEGAPG